MSSSSFAGAKPGFVFKMGGSGLGYYLDGSASKQPSQAASPAPALAAAPTRAKLSLVHRQGEATPALVEVAVACDSVAEASDIDVVVTSQNVCVLSSKKWQGKLEIPLQYEASPAQAQGWFHTGTLTLRIPVSG